jgi:hypothetical protein
MSILSVERNTVCPKRMTYGPCGGVRPDGGCEVGQLDCPFVSAPIPEWSGPAQQSGVHVDRDLRALKLRARVERGGVVVADCPARALDAESLRECAAALREVDAVLIGDMPRHRVQFPPSYRAWLLHAAGATAWVGLNARDRNRVALEGELAALADLHVGAAHCVTGDHTASGSRPDAAAVFDVDSTQLTAMAAGGGFIVSVAESPAAPPFDRRPARLLSKERAGAEVCVVNHCGGEGPVADFIRRSRALGCQAAMIACVPLVCEAGSAAQLATFRGQGIQASEYERIVSAADPRRAGIRAAVDCGRRMLDSGLVAGINLSGGPADGQELAYAEALAEAAEELRR